MEGIIAGVSAGIKCGVDSYEQFVQERSTAGIIVGNMCTN